jgi:hypothetical protein
MASYLVQVGPEMLCQRYAFGAIGRQLGRPEPAYHPGRAIDGRVEDRNSQGFVSCSAEALARRLPTEDRHPVRVAASLRESARNELSANSGKQDVRSGDAPAGAPVLVNVIHPEGKLSIAGREPNEKGTDIAKQGRPWWVLSAACR